MEYPKTGHFHVLPAKKAERTRFIRVLSCLVVGSPVNPRVQQKVSRIPFCDALERQNDSKASQI